MSQPRITEIKNKLMKVQEEGLKDTQKLLDQALAFNEWAMNVQREYMKMEQSVFHAKWKVTYLERKLKKIDPKIKLYEEATDDKKQK